MDEPDKSLPDALVRLLSPRHVTDDELASSFAEWLVGLSMFKQLNTPDRDIASFCRKKGWAVLGYDYENPPDIDELMGHTRGERLGEQLPIKDHNGPHSIWNVWLCLGDQLAQELASAPLAETMAALRRWPVVRSHVAITPATNVVPFKPRTQAGG
ncbi:MAG: hypothetical protein K2Y42_10300 [Hyphomicrobium sp.]|uniref:hypothetical protein n=1 Tax=Hyphomicrobium sp. TaxID=82 RepID=UPI0025C07B2C|nr:hypothetical protein [Hyphomicrobium sp.]MBX9863130.1 hypothetical protein [Hyphomicrobium sp.]